MSEVVNKIDLGKLTSKSDSLTYPYLEIMEMSNCIPLVVRALETGEIPLVGSLGETTKIVKKITLKSIEINKLLRVTNLKFHINSDEVRDIKNVNEYMEVLLEWI